jgi:hypothetical protein
MNELISVELDGGKIIKWFKAMELVLAIWKVPYVYLYSVTKENTEGP